MSKTLALNNFSDANIVETTELDADALKTVSSLVLKDNQGFSAGDVILIGQRGSETAELRTVDTVDSNLINLTITEALSLNHSRFDQVTKLFGSEMKIYRAITDGSFPTGADFGAAYSVIPIDPDQMSTRFTDASGDADNPHIWYKRTFHNQTTDQETPLSEAIAYKGAESSEYATVEEIRSKAGLQGNRWITDEKIQEKRRTAQAVIDGTLTGLYSVPFTPPVNQLINEITQMLAAGYILLQESTSAAARSQGQALVDQVTNKDRTGWLDKLDKKELKMVGLQGETQTAAETGGVTGWPNDSTGTDRNDPRNGAPRAFTTQDRY